MCNSKILHLLSAVVPLERWDVDAFVARRPSAFEARFGAFVSGAQLFDAAAFGITSSEAMLMDPQQRLLLQQAAQALYQQRAATGDELVCTHGGAFAAPERTSVMVGIGPAEYVSETNRLPLGVHSATGAATSVAAGRCEAVLLCNLPWSCMHGQREPVVPNAEHSCS